MESRREFVKSGLAAGWLGGPGERLTPLIVRVQVMFDAGAHSLRGLSQAEISRFNAFQETARREYAASGIQFDLQFEPGAYLQQQGYSIIRDKFLVRDRINLFVTESLGYDIDKDRTGGCSIGPRKPSRRSGGDPFYKTFLGLKDARETTLPHEYAHHFTLDTLHHSSATGNLWADLRNDYWLWRQRHGTAIPAFRACAGAPWASLTPRP